MVSFSIFILLIISIKFAKSKENSGPNEVQKVTGNFGLRVFRVELNGNSIIC